jgi:uncharacterized protein
MWSRVAEGIIRFRILLMGIIGVITVVMGYYASKVELSYEFTRTVPPNDPEMIFFTNFKKQFGEDGNVMAIGIKDSALYKVENFQKFRELSNKIRTIEGVNEVLSLPLLRIILKDTANSKFYLTSLFPETVQTQGQLDSLLQIAMGQKFYMGQLVNADNGATMIVAPMNKEYANSAKRIGITKSLMEYGTAFTEQTGIQLHYAGLPFVRSIMAEQVRKELLLFTVLSGVITGLIMLLFFRSIRAVIF